MGKFDQFSQSIYQKQKTMQKTNQNRINRLMENKTEQEKWFFLMKIVVVRCSGWDNYFPNPNPWIIFKTSSLSKEERELVDHHEIFKKLTFIFDVWIVVISLSQIFSFSLCSKSSGIWHLYPACRKKNILYVVVANKTEKEKQDSGQLKYSKNYWPHQW